MSTSLKLTAVYLVALIMQLSIFIDVRVAGVAPELLALVAVIAGFFAGTERGPVIAFCAGLVWDVYLPTPLGVAAVAFALVAFAVASLEQGLFHDSRFQMLSVVTIASAATVVGYALIGELVGQRGLVDVEMLRVAVLVGLLNGALTPIALPVVRWALLEGDGR